MDKNKNAFAWENLGKRANDMALEEWMYVNNRCEPRITVKNALYLF